MQGSSDRKTQTHERILEVAARAIRRGGYAGIGVADIMKEAGLTHGGFYAHFASRDAMLVEAMQRAAAQGDQHVAGEAAQRRKAGDSALAALVNTYLHDSQLTGAECGCVVAALASEMPRQQEAVLVAARERVQHLLDAVRAALPGEASGHAPAITASLVGGLQLARTLGSRPGKALLASIRHSLLQQYDPRNAS
ncbi:MAG: TetR/AcrR family transcriptional regulator [Steroidobacteraceae bacterium]